jgi:excisionase family DNA binding protein
VSFRRKTMAEELRAPGEDKALTPEEVALVLGVSVWTVKKLVKSGELPCEYINRRPMFALKALVEHFRGIEGGRV